MENKNTNIYIDSPERIFFFIKENYEGKESKEKFIPNSSDSYELIEIFIGDGPKDYTFTFGLRKKSNNDGQMLLGWAHNPVKLEESVNNFDPKPFVTIESFKEESKDPHLAIDYAEEIRGIQSPYVKVVQILQSAIMFILLGAQSN